jgi:hypothetical protein
MMHTSRLKAFRFLFPPLSRPSSQSKFRQSRVSTNLNAVELHDIQPRRTAEISDLEP